MTVEDLLETFYEEGLRAFKKRRNNSSQARKLDRHESIPIGETTVSCWREFVMMKVAEYIQELLPDADVRVILDGNESYIDADLSDDETQKLAGTLNGFLQKVGCMRS